MTTAAPAMLEPPVTLQSTVFVVDDDPAVRKSLRWLMESVGLHVQTFGSAQEFLAAYDPHRAGCIVMDVRMPGMGGLELQERLRELGCRLPMIVMTAYGDVPMAVRAMKSGAVHFFEKPINNQNLLEQIQVSLADDARRIEDEAQQRLSETRYRRLTPREAQVLDEVVGGFSSKEIGAHLGISFKTIEAHRAKIMKKMEADSVPHLIRMYLDLPPELRVTEGRDDEARPDSDA
ncbi:MAG: response regulator [Planctomycetaceae bacterium]|nr:response regulator [Planctomycetaceae bacterium]